jgi:hypothetical protein
LELRHAHFRQPEIGKTFTQPDDYADRFFPSILKFLAHIEFGGRANGLLPASRSSIVTRGRFLQNRNEEAGFSPR